MAISAQLVFYLYYCPMFHTSIPRLEKIEQVKRDIQELKRPLVAELKSFTEPPPAVLNTMVSTYILLGQ